MADQITLTIDGVEVKAEPGKAIIQAAMDAGIYIPYLCYYPGMKPYGACRMCVVEIGNQRGTPASCTTPVADGMEVHTSTPQIVGLRRDIMELLISEHPHGCLTCHRIELCGPQDICLRHVAVTDRCVTCPKNERCELKDTVRSLEMDMDTPLTYNYRHLPIEVQDPYYDRDYNLCIVCARCVRVCEETRGDNAIAMIERAGKALVGTSHGSSLLESGCEFCGACIDVCPTGALVERGYKWEKALKTVTSVCPHCPVGCQMTLEIDKRNRLIRAVPDRHAAANQGQACFKGKFGMDFVNHRQRLKRPLVRRNGSLEEADWDEALDLIAQRLREYRGDRFGIIASPRGTNEDSYVAQKFARVAMSTNNVDLFSNVHPEVVGLLGKLMGFPAGTNSIWDIERAECVAVVSSNVTEEQNVAAVPIKKAVKNGAKLLVIDPRETELTRYATMWLRAKPGTETALIGGILRVIEDESLDDHEFVAQHCDNMDTLRRSLWGFDLIKVEEITGIPQAQVQEAARLFAKSKPSALLYALDTVATEDREELVRSLINLALITGNVDKPAGGLFPLYPGANEQGSKDVGCNPGFLPGYQPVEDGEARKRFQEAWGSPIPSDRGSALKEMVQGAMDGRVKALLMMGDSPNLTNGELGDALEAFRKLDFLVVQNAFLTELAELAHVVLPSATFAEKQGTYTNLERRVQLLRPAVEPKGEEKPDWWVLSQLAQRMGARGFGYAHSSEIMDEISGLVPFYGGISHQRLEDGGIQWPCPSGEHPGTPSLYADGFYGRKATFTAMTLHGGTRRAGPDYPLLFAVGRVLHQPERELEVVHGDGMNLIRRDEIVEIHPEDASSLGITEGEWIEVVSARERFKARAKLSSPHSGLVSTVLLFGELVTRLEASRDPDPMLNVPGLPLVPVMLEKATE